MQHFKLELQKPDWEKWTGGKLQISGIHIWKATLHDQAANFKKNYSCLSETEKERAGRYRFESVRQRFIAAHGIVREILGCYLGLLPAALEFDSLPSGKPFLAGKTATGLPEMKFNFSHSEDLLLLTVSKIHELGIDGEWIKPDFEHVPVSEHFFAPDEMKWLQSLEPDLQTKAFYQLWTCKEAVLKAVGSGLRRKLEEVKIEFYPGKELALCKVDWSLTSGDAWAVKTFSPEPGYTAALAFNLDASAAISPEFKFYEWEG